MQQYTPPAQLASSMAAGPARRQGLLFDAPRSAAARDAAVEAVLAKAADDSCDALYAAILDTARAMPDFTTDDVWQRVPAVIRRSVEPRVIGSLMIQAAKAGHVVRIDGVYRASEMVRCHRRPKQVWQSSMLGGAR